MRTIFCIDAQEAEELASEDKDGRAMVTGPGTLAFHHSIAAHAAGDFFSLYVPLELKGKYVRPAGGEIYYTKAADEKEPA